jgi:hypothetical protein
LIIPNQILVSNFEQMRSDTYNRFLCCHFDSNRMELI